MLAPAILTAAAMSSALPAGPQKQMARPPQQYETLEDLFDSNAGTWTNVSLASPTMDEHERNDDDSLYRPVVRETLKTPPPQPWLHSDEYPFGITR